MIPKDDLFNLLESQKTPEKTTKKITEVKPKTHIKSKVFITVLTEKASLSPEDVTPELAKMARLTKKREFLPMVQSNVLREKSSYFIEVTKNVTEIDLEFNYTPSSVGKFRLIALIENSLQQLTNLGFTSKDLDEVKEIFADTNLYFLMGTILIGSVHVSLRN
jgi:Cleft lip and palate transmembrane protein 1 (CLPTM1)